MARWTLQTAHYLSVPDTIWEHRETDTRTQKSVRKDFPVPLYLDPRDPADHNYKEDGLIIVSNKHSPAFPRDIIFVGPPTPDMVPLDDEAQAITNDHAPKWQHPVDKLGDEGYGGSLIKDLEAMLAEAVRGAGERKAAPTQSISEGMVSKDEFEQLKAQMSQLMQMNQALMEELSARHSAEVDGVDDSVVIEDAPAEVKPAPETPSAPVHPSVAARMATERRV